MGMCLSSPPRPVAHLDLIRDMQQVVLFKVFPVHIWVAFAAVGWGTASVAQVRAIDSLGDPHLSEPFPTFHRQAATTSQRSLCAESFWPFLKLVGDFVNARTPSSVAG